MGDSNIGLQNRYGFIIWAIGFVSLEVFAGGNYVVSRTMLDASGNRHFDRVDYFDGLGRNIETMMRGTAPDGGDVVTLTEYDCCGRPFLQWCPVYGHYGGFVTYEEFRSNAVSQYDDNRPFTETEYEQSLTNDVTAQYRPGDVLHGKAVSTRRLVNDMTDALVCYDFRIKSDGSLHNLRKYPKGALLVTETEDEDGNTVAVFCDYKGRVLLTRSSINDGEYADTYRVYDNYGDLRYIIPPVASDMIAVRQGVSKTWNKSDEVIDRYCYYYERDILGHVTLKKIPGRDEILYRYDAINRLTLTQDGRQRSGGETDGWTFIFQDRLGRPAVRGRISVYKSEADAILRDSHVAVFDGIDYLFTFGYRIDGNTAMADDYYNADVAYFYDDYRFIETLAGGNDEEYAWRESPYSGTRHSPAAGRMTGKYVHGTGLTVYYYDSQGNVVQQHSRNRLGGYDRLYAAYTFTGQPLRERREHTSKNGTVTESLRYEYDNSGLLTAVYHRLGENAEVRLEEYCYNGLLQLESRVVGDAYRLDYAYDVQGRNVEISSSVFGQRREFETAGLYSGMTSSDIVENGRFRHKYRYGYDGLDRLVSADYLGSVEKGAFSAVYSYDKNGNPKSILRRGITEKFGDSRKYDKVDNLQFDYIGNQIDCVYEYGSDGSYEGATDFTQRSIGNKYRWDANGNLFSDMDRGISQVSYDSYDNPSSVRFSDGNFIRYVYDAEGQKLSTEYLVQNIRVALPGDKWQIVDSIPGGIRQLSSEDAYSSIISEGSRESISTAGKIDSLVFGMVDTMVVRAYNTRLKRDYCGNVIYRNDTIERILTPTGYVDAAGNYFHYVHDIQGCVRAVVGHTGNVVERTDYYPFGMIIPESTDDVQPYKFSGKEFDRMSGLNFYDFHARQYDPSILRFTSQDPLAELNPSVSPYLYCSGNPVNRNDHTGFADFLDDDGKWLGCDGNEDYRLFLLKTKINSLSSGVNVLGLSNIESENTVKFVRDNSGNPAKFAENESIYDNFVEIPGDGEIRSAMAKIVGQDDGKGGRKPERNREYGGTIEDGRVKEANPGEVGSPASGASILMPSGNPTFHSHPSGFESPFNFHSKKWGKLDYKQPPSQADIDAAGNHINYVFGRADGNVYIYDKEGVRAVIPLKRFVKPKNFPKPKKEN